MKVVPRGSATGFSGLMADGTVKVAVSAPPVEGRANEALVEWLSNQFGVGRDEVAVVTGRQSRRKTVRIHNPTEIPPWFHG